MPDYHLSAMLTRDGALRFACWALAQERAAQQVFWSSYNPDRKPYRETVYMVALRELLEAYPAHPDDDPDASMFTRLSREPDRAVLSRYLRRVTELGRKGDSVFAADDLRAWWDVFDTWHAIADAIQSPPRPPPPMRVDLLESGTPEQALEAFMRIPEGRAPARGSAEEALVAAGINAWIRRFDDAAPNPERKPKDCACDQMAIHPLRPEDHIARCPRFEAWQKVGELQRALRMAGVANPPGPDLARLFAKPGPGEHPPWLTERASGQEALDDWIDGEKQTGRGNHPPRVVVHALLREAVRLAHPEAVACPFCAAVIGMEKLEPHLWACDAHPAKVALRELEAAIAGTPTALAVLEDAKERETVERTLRELIEACERFDSDQGWNGDCAYSKAWCERPWLQALDRAEEIAALRRAASPTGNAGSAGPMRALGELLAACRVYWSSAGDGGDRSLFSAHSDEVWKREIAKAKEALSPRIRGKSSRSAD